MYKVNFNEIRFFIHVSMRTNTHIAGYVPLTASRGKSTLMYIPRSLSFHQSAAIMHLSALNNTVYVLYFVGILIRGNGQKLILRNFRGF